MDYLAPTADQLLAMRVCAGIETLGQYPLFADASPDVVAAIAEGIGEFAAREWAPLAARGDVRGAVFEDGVVRLPDGFAEAYRAYVAAGWNAISCPAEHGGQGLPFTLACCVMENLGAANMAFSLLPMLTVGAIEALVHHGSAEQQARWLPKLVSGEWSGTMNLTEPQAGSDVGALRTSATPIAEGPQAGKYRLKGSKIFITWGEHELAGNIVHLVLARLPDAPSGSAGISLFLVPRFHLDADGNPAGANDVKAIGIEHKLGIHASPTCVMSYGEHDDCLGEIIGAPNGGLRAMFTMMNAARIHVGGQGVQVAEAALQRATAYARQRVQSARAGAADRGPVPIVEHPDVRRMLLRMRALTEGARALLYYTAGQVDRGALGDASARARADVLVPLLKAWGTDVGCEVASLAVQVHGGMGYIEETGVARLFRDARIAPIYEGTNGIQAADLVTRKLGLDDGRALAGLLAEASAVDGPAPQRAALADACGEIAGWMRTSAGLDDRLAGSVPFLTMCAVAIAGGQLDRQARALASEAPATDAARRKDVVARFFNETIVGEAIGLKAGAMAGAGLLYALDAETLAG